MKKVVIVAAHPDDETFGCGGTILKHKFVGDEVNWVILTNIDINHGWSEEKVRLRQEEIEKVKEMYGFKKLYTLNFPTTLLDTVPMNELVGAISKVFLEIEPEVVYLVNHSDIHTDHQVTFHATLSCTKNFRFPFIKRVLMYEALSETEFAPALANSVFIPNVFVDISEFYKEKIKITNLYKSELMTGYLPRSESSMEALARFRGSRIGTQYAEAFNLLFECI